MKMKQILLASTVLISTVSFAQKDEIKAAEKAMKSGNSVEAVSILKQAESVIAGASEAEKANYFFVKGNALLDLATKKVQTTKNLSAAAQAYQELLNVERSSGKSKFSSQAQSAIANIKDRLINSAIEEGNKNNNKEASDLLNQAYNLDKTDVEKLYYAANYAVNAEDYIVALKYYEELKALNYSGEKTVYYAKNIVSDAEESFATKAERDKMVGLKLYSNPREEKETSKRGEIYKNIALILVQQNKTDEAKAAIAEARKENPEDTSLMLTEADLYLKLDDLDNYKKLISQILQKNPNDADLTYNLGVITLKSEQLADAEKYFRRAIEIDPKYVNAYINLAAIQLKSDKKLVDEMNKLGTSVKENKRYEELKNERVKLFKSTLPNLEKALELDPKNDLVVDNLLSVYNFLEMTDKYKALKAKQ